MKLRTLLKKTTVGLVLVGFILTLLTAIQPARAAGADDFIITVKTDNPGSTSNTEFRIPAYSVDPFAAGYALFARDDSDTRALYFQGPSDTTITGAGIFSNSTDSLGSIYFEGTGNVNVEYDITSAGGIYIQYPERVIAGEIVTEAAPINISQPDLPDCTGLPIRDGSGTSLLPGVYPDGINIGDDRDVTLAPGLYCLEGDLRTLNGSLTGDGVTFYMRNGSQVVLNGGDIDLRAPKNDSWADGSGKFWNGMLIYGGYTGLTNLVISSNVGSYFQGTIFKIGNCSLNGFGDTSPVDIKLVCGTIDLIGTADLLIDYNPENHYQATTVPDYNYNVDCDNDGSDEATAQTGSYTCSYPSAGTYTIRISDNSGTGEGFPGIFYNNTGDKDKLLSIDQWGTGKWKWMHDAFYGCSNLTSSAADAPDLSSVTDLKRMFSGASSFNADLSRWDTSNISSMFGMFQGASSFNQDLSSWVTSGVKSFSHMFDGAAAFNSDLGSWDTSAARDMSAMFQGVTAFDQDIGSWNTENVWDLSDMFNGATAFNQNLNGWDTSNFKNLSGMYKNASAFNGDISGWNTSAVVDMSEMFRVAAAFNQPIGSWDTSNVTDMYGLFSYAQAFNQPLGSWDTSRVTNMAGMFVRAESFNQNIGAWDTGNVQFMTTMFSGATLFNQNIGSWNTANVVRMDSMFKQAEAFNQPIGSWNTSQVFNMEYMFYHAYSFNQDLSGWDTGQVTNMHEMFQATPFDQDISSWDVRSLEVAFDMFEYAELSTANYDALLIGWDAQDLPSGVGFGGGNSTYCAGEAARDNMISTDYWKITDGGKHCGGPPANDNLDSPEAISALPYTNTQSTLGATVEVDEPVYSCGYWVDGSVWYTFTPSSTGGFNIDTFGSDYDTVLHIFEDTGAGFSEVVCNDNNIGLESSVIATLNGGTSYLVGIAGYGGEKGNLVLNFELLDDTPPTGSFTAPLQNGTLLIPRTWINVDADDNVGVQSVTFSVYYDNQWHQVFEDTDQGDGWEVLLPTESIPEGFIKLRAEIVDLYNIKTTIEVANVTLTSVFTSSGGSQTRGEENVSGGRAREESVATNHIETNQRTVPISKHTFIVWKHRQFTSTMFTDCIFWTGNHLFNQPSSVHSVTLKQ